MVDHDLVNGYLAALRQTGEKAAQRAATHWFVMDVETQKAALATAKAEKLLV